MMILDDQDRIDADNDYSTLGQALQGYYAAVQRDTVRSGTNDTARGYGRLYGDPGPREAHVR